MTVPAKKRRLPVQLRNRTRTELTGITEIPQVDRTNIQVRKVSTITPPTVRISTNMETGSIRKEAMEDTTSGVVMVVDMVIKP